MINETYLDILLATLQNAGVQTERVPAVSVQQVNGVFMEAAS